MNWKNYNSNWKKRLGFRNMQEKLENVSFHLQNYLFMTQPATATMYQGKWYGNCCLILTCGFVQIITLVTRYSGNSWWVIFILLEIYLGTFFNLQNQNLKSVNIRILTSQWAWNSKSVPILLCSTSDVFYMSFDKFLLAFGSRGLSQAEKSIIWVSSFPKLSDE